MRISERATVLQASPIRKFVPLANETKKRGIKVHHLNIGQPDVETPEAFMEAIRKFDHKTISYANSQGDVELIEAMSKYYARFGLDFKKEDIIITSGGSEALNIVISTLCNPDDEIIAPEPFYTNYASFAAINQVIIKSVPTDPEDGFLLPSKEEFEKVINDKTRAILISNPCNPTGAIYPKEQLEILKELALEHDIVLISDEVYREFTYDGLSFTSLASFKEIEDKVVIIDSISKRYSACGARIGNIACKNKEFMANIMKFAQARLCCPTLEMVGAKALYDLEPSYFDAILKEYQERRDVLYEGLMSIDGVTCKKPTGAFYIVAALPVEDAEDFVKFLLQDFSDNGETVMITPAENFYKTEGKGRNHVRLTYALNKNDLRRSIELLDKGLKAYKNR